MVLDKIQKENDIKKLTTEELDQLRREIRAFLIKSISLGKEKYGLPEKETKIMTNFIR